MSDWSKEAPTGGALYVDLEKLSRVSLAKCLAEGWDRRWTHAGCYLHLEVSELIEAIRGKRGDPAAEASDVLFALLSMLRANGVSLVDVVGALRGQLQCDTHTLDLEVSDV